MIEARFKKIIFFVMIAHLSTASWAPHVTAQKEGSRMNLSSPAFKNNETIPARYTCQGENVSPALAWGNPPEKTKSFALLCDDPDAPQQDPWVHWIVFNIPAGTQSLAEGITLASIPGAKGGMNSFGKHVYGGPCPPKGHGIHHYHFKLYALDTLLDLSQGASKEELIAALKGHILAQTELIGLYERK